MSGKANKLDRLNLNWTRSTRLKTGCLEKVRIPGSQFVFSVTIEGSRIASVNTIDDDKGSPERADSNVNLLTPGLIDVHTHGIGRYLYENGPEDLLSACKMLPSFGTTCVLPTIVPYPDKADFMEGLSLLSNSLDKVDSVCVPGLHLEGPFVAVPGAACKLSTGDLGLLDELLSACGHRVKAMSISPDVSGIIPIIEKLVENQIVPFITHTRADVEQTMRAIEAGATHATHFYDVFYPPEPTDGGVRPVGSVEAILADDRCSVDFVCDGVHVHPMAIKAALAARGYEKIICITDSNIGAGLDPGTYNTPWGFRVKVSPENGARVADTDHPSYGGLAGSALTMDAGINNLLSWLDLPEEHVWAMGTANPANLVNLPSKAAIEPGSDADMVLWRKENGRYRPICTWVAGNCVYQDEDALGGIDESQ